MAEHKSCLVLNQDYTPLGIIDWKRAQVLQLFAKESEGGIRVVKYYEEDVVFSAGGEPFPVPAVIVCGHFVKRKKIIALRKKNLLIRDDKKCQYCGLEVGPKAATIDHVKPKSHFDDKRRAHTWRNTVIACRKCNSKKDDRTPEQAGMTLLKIPYEPTPGEFYEGRCVYNNIPEEWKSYVNVKS